MYMQRDDKRAMKDGMRLPRTPHKSKIRFLVSVWLDEEQAWLEDIRFRYIEDAKVHAARWGRLYGATVTQISEVEA